MKEKIRKMIVKKINYIAAAVLLIEFTVLFSILNLKALLPGVDAPYHVYAALMLYKNLSLNNEIFSLFPAVTALLTTFMGDALLATKIMAALVYTLLSLSVYFYTSRILNEKLLALAALLLASMHPAFLNMLFEGTYNVLLCAAIYVFFTSLLLKSGKAPNKKSYITLFALSILSPLASLELAKIIAISLALSIIYYWRREKRKSVSSLSLLVSLSSVYVYYGAWAGYKPPALEYPLKNQQFIVDLAGGPFIFSLQILLAIAYLVSLAYKKERAKLVKNIVALAPPSALSVFQNPLTIIILSAITLPASITHLTKHREAVEIRKVKEDKEEAIEVEISMEKATALVLALILIGAVYVQGFGIATSYAEASPPHYYEQLLEASEWIKYNLTSRDVLAAPPEIIKWLEVFSEKKIALENTREYYEMLDAITSTIHRIETPYLRIDEWEPCSTAKAPLVYSWNGVEYVPLLHIDDSFVRVYMKENGKEIIESSYKTPLINKTKIGDGKETIGLYMCFETKRIRIEKETMTWINKPVVEVTYTITPISNVQLIKLTLPVWTAHGSRVEKPRQEGNTFTMKVNGIDVKITYHNPQKSTLVTKHHIHAESIYLPSDNKIVAKVTIEVLDAEKRSVEPKIIDIIEAARTYRINYMLIYNKTKVHLEQALDKNIEQLYIVDAFMRFLINSYGIDWIEAPHNAEVLDDKTIEEKEYTTRIITYKTAGLIITKTIKYNPRKAILTYNAKPHKEKTYLKQAMISLWIPWERSLRSYKIENGNITLELDAGTITVTIKPTPSFIDIGPHPEYKQLRVYARIDLPENEGEYTITIASSKGIKIEYEETTRPAMKDSDILHVYAVYIGFYKYIEKFEPNLLLVRIYP